MSHCGPLLTDPRYLELKDRFAGLVVLVGTMAFCLGLSVWAKELARPELQLRASPSTYRGVVGWPHQVDALGSLDAARRSSRPRELRKIVLEGVKSDGTIDVVTGPGSATYLFHNGVKKPKQKKGHAFTVRPALCPRQVVRIRGDGLDPQAELKEFRCPEFTSDPLPVPTCGPRELWARAIQKGASIRQLAHMEYYLSNAGPAWKMVLPRERLQLTMSQDCQTELGPLDAVPVAR